MDPWLIFSWVSAICLTIVVIGITSLLLTGMGKAISKSRSKAPTEVSIFRGFE